MLWSRLLQGWLVVSLVLLPLQALANEEDNTTTTTTTTTTIPGEIEEIETFDGPEETTTTTTCLLYTSPSPRDGLLSRMPSSA